jgi:hypothetical protein
MSLKALTNQFENVAETTTRSSPGLFTSKASPTRLLSVPASAAAAVSEASASASATTSAATPAAAAAGSSFWRYFLVFLILGFLGLNLVLFLFKPVDTDISHLYDPVMDFFNAQFGTHFKGSKKGPIVASVSKKNNATALKKLEKTLDAKPVINNIDNKHIDTKDMDNEQAVGLAPEPVKKYKRLPVIPEADDSTSRVQMNPSSKSGFCYIGEDRGFRSCIEVGEGDVCMSGNIFPTEAICINPNLRE